MRSVEDIWKRRLSEHVKELRTYLRYMFNDHLLFVLLFIVGGGAYWYQGWLKNIPESFPATVVLTTLWAIIVSFAHVRTLLKEADIVYMIPLEKDFNVYFKKAFSFSFVMQLYPLILVTVILTPLYVRVFPTAPIDLALLFSCLLLMKLWNQWLQWMVSSFPEKSAQYSDKIVRFAMNFLLIYFFLVEAYLYMALVSFIMLGYTFYFQKSAKQKSVKWEFLIVEESRRQNQFYQLANLFTDVPKLKNQVKRRKWLDFILSRLTYKQEHTYLYLFSRSFLRTGDYFGIFARLLIIGAILLIMMPVQLLGSVFIALSVLFLTGIQLTSLYKQHDVILLPKLYPVSESLKKASFLQLLTRLLVIQAVFLMVITVMQIGVISGLIQLGISTFFAITFAKAYIGRRFVH